MPPCNKAAEDVSDVYNVNDSKYAKKLHVLCNVPIHLSFDHQVSDVSK